MKPLAQSACAKEFLETMQATEAADWKLMGSAPSQEALEKLLKDKFYSKEISLHPNGEVYDVHNAKGKIDGLRVKNQKGRWKLERQV